VASVLAGAKQDLGTLTSSNASGLQKLGAAASLATELFSPVSARDAKAGAKFVQKKLAELAALLLEHLLRLNLVCVQLKRLGWAIGFSLVIQRQVKRRLNPLGT